LIKGYNKKIGTCDALYGEWWYVRTGYEFGHDLEGTFFSFYSGKWLKVIDRHDLGQFQIYEEYLYLSSTYHEAAKNQLTCANQP
jgi:hypothetical protein